MTSRSVVVILYDVTGAAVRRKSVNGAHSSHSAKIAETAASKSKSIEFEQKERSNTF